MGLQTGPGKQSDDIKPRQAAEKGIPTAHGQGARDQTLSP